MLIGIGATGQVGKDTMYSLLEKYGTKNYRRYAMADALKEELRPRIKQEFGFNILDCSNEQKNQARPLLVEVGCGRRAENPNYWVEKVYSNIVADLSKDKSIVPVLCDCRFLNEIEYFNQRFPDFKYIHLTREGVEPLNEEEARNAPEMASYSGALHFHWGDIEKYSERDLSQMVAFIEENL